MRTRWFWAQPIRVGGITLVMLGGGAISASVAITDPSANWWQRLLLWGFVLMAVGAAALLAFSGAARAGDRGVAALWVWRERRRGWVPWSEITSFGTNSGWDHVGIVITGGEFQVLVRMMDFDLIDWIDLLRPNSPASRERAGRRLIKRLERVRALHSSGDPGQSIAIVDGPPLERRNRRPLFSGRRRERR